MLKAAAAVMCKVNRRTCSKFQSSSDVVAVGTTLRDGSVVTVVVTQGGVRGRDSSAVQVRLKDMKQIQASASDGFAAAWGQEV